MNVENKKVKAAKFVLENCEILLLNLTNIKYYDIIIGNCHESFHVQHGIMFSRNSTKYLSLKLEWQQFYDNLGYDFEFVPEEGHNEGITKAYKRFKYKDITAVCIIFEDDTEIDIGVPWRGEWKNKAQYIKIRKADEYRPEMIEITFDYNYYWNEFIWQLKYGIKISISNFFYRISQIFKRRKI